VANVLRVPQGFVKRFLIFFLKDREISR